MTTLALQMNPNDPAFWVMVVVAVSFFTIAIAMIYMAVYVSRAVKSVNRLEQKLEPLIEKLTFVGEQSKQVGGVPMTLGKAAVPFGGGRVVSLFSHKDYDILSLEYVDTNMGLHGAIFQLNKGQGGILRNELVAGGAHVSPTGDEATKQSTAEVSNENK